MPTATKVCQRLKDWQFKTMYGGFVYRGTHYEGLEAISHVVWLFHLEQLMMKKEATDGLAIQMHEREVQGSPCTQ